MTAPRPLMLIILDGWGVAPPGPGNATDLAQTPTLDRLFATCPHTTLRTSGLDVGLPDGQMGNSEVGHTNIGAGRIVYQDLTRISKAIDEGTFQTNRAFQNIMDHRLQDGTALHIMGLLSDGGVHSHIDHLEALLRMAKARGLTRVFVHAFYDGRDTPPDSGLRYTKRLLATMDTLGVGRLATLSGRYYAMDRDHRWARTEKAYRALVLGEGAETTDPLDALARSYAANVTDEFIVPTVVVDDTGHPVGLIGQGDGVIDVNFRPDRARQMIEALADPDFSAFVRPKNDLNLEVVTMSEYDAAFSAYPKLSVAFPPEVIVSPLGEVLSRHGLTQLRIAETEKYAHVTFFFNGGEETPYPGEDRCLLPSPQVATYDLKPEMSAPEVTDAVVKAIREARYDVIVLNFANCDMVGHTGVLTAAVAAVEAVDKGLGQIVDALQEVGGAALITADHGNCEQMIDPKTGGPFTAHTTNPVPLIGFGLPDGMTLTSGRLCDLAPTLLALLGLTPPSVMTGHSLLASRRS